MDICSYILKVPFDSEDSQGIVYVWIGKRANAEEARLAEEIADDMYGVSRLGPLIVKQANFLLP